MLDKSAIIEIVEEKFDDRNGKFDFISRDYLDAILGIVVEAILESCDECRMTKRRNIDG